MDGCINSNVAYQDNGFNFPPLNFSSQPWPTCNPLAYEGKAYEHVYFVVSLDFTLIICYNHKHSFKNLLIPTTLHHLKVDHLQPNVSSAENSPPVILNTDS